MGRWPQLIPRLEANVFVMNNGCWLWTGTCSSNGYGRVFALGQRWSAHRLVWFLLRGPVPAGLDLDHLCRNRLCVNPNHLEPVTRSENNRRGLLGDRNNHLNTHKTICLRGHLLSSDNVYLTKDKRRQCRKCGAMRQAAFARRQAAIGALPGR